MIFSSFWYDYCLASSSGSHPIVTATVFEIDSGAIVVSTEYFRHSNESGVCILLLAIHGHRWH